ncbi:hypothetical protein ACIGW5_27865 [Streptomyces prasinus]|uniref:hypothetical protein n=1 Tax=Streptomyces prasinus TaxID=67345 RepID=UPI0037CFCDB7
MLRDETQAISVAAGGVPSLFHKFDKTFDFSVSSALHNGHPAGNLRALGQGWADGLDPLARAHGVDIA